MPQGKQGKNSTHCPRCAEGMASGPFGRTYGGQSWKHFCDQITFLVIVQFGTCAMGVNIADVSRGQTAAAQTILQSNTAAVVLGIWGGEVVSVGAEA